MKINWKTYLALLFVFLGSFTITLSLPAESVARQIASFPGMIALIGTLYQILRDENQYRRDIEIQRSKQQFDIAFTSHMANIAFDKHVEFCEQYIAAFQSAIFTLFQTGGSESLLSHAQSLVEIRAKHRAWLTKKIETDLAPFESALRTIGAAAQFYTADPGQAVSSGSMQKSHDTMLNIFGFENTSSSSPIDNAIKEAEVIQRIRSILGIEELTHLRYKHLEPLNRA